MPSMENATVTITIPIPPSPQWQRSRAGTLLDSPHEPQVLTLRLLLLRMSCDIVREFFRLPLLKDRKAGVYGLSFPPSGFRTRPGAPC